MSHIDHAVAITGHERAEFLAEPRGATPLAPDEVSGAYRGAEFPRRPGYAAVFRVCEVGEAVADFAPTASMAT